LKTIDVEHTLNHKVEKKNQVRIKFLKFWVMDFWGIRRSVKFVLVI